MAPFLYTHTHTQSNVLIFANENIWEELQVFVPWPFFSVSSKNLWPRLATVLFHPSNRACVWPFFPIQIGGGVATNFCNLSRSRFFFLCDVVVGHSTFFLFRRMIPLFFSSVPTCNKKNMVLYICLFLRLLFERLCPFLELRDPSICSKRIRNRHWPIFFLCEFLKSLNKTRILANGVIYGRLRLLLHVFTLYFSCVASVVMIRSSLLSEERTATVRTKTKQIGLMQSSSFNETLLLRHFFLSFGKQKTLAQRKFLDFKFAFFFK